MVAGMAFRPKKATYQVMNRGPRPKARVPPVLNTDIDRPAFEPEYRGTMPVTEGWNIEEPTEPSATQ